MWERIQVKLFVALVNVAQRRHSCPSEEISDYCMVKENGRILKDFSEEVSSKLWSKAATFRVVGEGSDGVFVQAIKGWRLGMAFLFLRRLNQVQFPYECHFI